MHGSEPKRLLVTLRPDGRLAVIGPEADPLDPDARWETLGWVWQGGRRLGFVRAQIGKESWAAWVRSDWLDEANDEPRVKLVRQSSGSSESFTGWILFC